VGFFAKMGASKRRSSKTAKQAKIIKERKTNAVSLRAIDEKSAEDSSDNEEGSAESF
jgi:hypothetical protein